MEQMELLINVSDVETGKTLFTIKRYCEFIRPGLLDKYIEKYSEVGFVSFVLNRIV